MGKRYARALLLCPEKYSLYNSLYDILYETAEEVRGADLNSLISSREIRINTQIFRLPFSLRKRWEAYYMGKMNRMLLKAAEEFSPDIILVYNSTGLLPETCSLMKGRSKLVFFMGDSPFYTPQNNYYLACLSHADLILSPDSFWNGQLNTIGLNNTLYFIPGPDLRSYFRTEATDAYPGVEETEILYVGASYLNSWGYKKALLMSRFTRFNFRIYGNSAWRRWFSYFPDLEPVFRESGFIPQGRLNGMFNMTKLIPVDGNPGILNGVHLRMFEALGSGALPLIEYRQDVDNLLFSNYRGDLPLIKDYHRATDIAAHYLKNEQERKMVALSMKEYILKEYSPSVNAGRLNEALEQKG